MEKVIVKRIKKEKRWQDPTELCCSLLRASIRKPALDYKIILYLKKSNTHFVLMSQQSKATTVWKTDLEIMNICL